MEIIFWGKDSEFYFDFVELNISTGLDIQFEMLSSQ